MSSTVAVQLPRKSIARITGGLYLAFILASVLADRTGRIGISEAESAYDVLASNAGQFSLGVVFALVSAFLFLMAAWGLYVLLKPVNHELALLLLVLNAIGVAIQCASMFPLVFAIPLSDGSSFIQSYSAEQVKDLALASIDLYKSSFVIAQLFFGTWLFPLGYLVYRSGFLPRFLGVLLILDGFAVLLWFVQAFLLPDYTAIIYPGLALSFVAEFGLGLWLLIKGVKDAGPAVSSA